MFTIPFVQCLLYLPLVRFESRAGAERSEGELFLSVEGSEGFPREPDRCVFLSVACVGSPSLCRVCGVNRERSEKGDGR